MTVTRLAVAPSPRPGGSSKREMRPDGDGVDDVRADAVRRHLDARLPATDRHRTVSPVALVISTLPGLGRVDARRSRARPRRRRRRSRPGRAVTLARHGRRVVRPCHGADARPRDSPTALTANASYVRGSPFGARCRGSVPSAAHSRDDLAVPADDESGERRIRELPRGPGSTRSVRRRSAYAVCDDARRRLRVAEQVEEQRAVALGVRAPALRIAHRERRRARGARRVLRTTWRGRMSRTRRRTSRRRTRRSAAPRTTSSGVRGSGFTSPGAPITVIEHDVPAACVHCFVSEPPCGSVDGAEPTRRMSRTGATAVWLVTETIAASSEPGDRAVGARDRDDRAVERHVEGAAGVVDGVLDALPVLAELPGRHVAQVERRGLARADRHRPGTQLRLRVERAHQDRHREVGPVVLTLEAHRHLTGVDPRRAGARVVSHDGAGLHDARGVLARAGGADVVAHLDAAARAASPRGRARSNDTDSSSVTSGGRAPAFSASARSSSPGTRRNAYVVTVARRALAGDRERDDAGRALEARRCSSAPSTSTSVLVAPQRTVEIRHVAARPRRPCRRARRRPAGSRRASRRSARCRRRRDSRARSLGRPSRR